MYHYMSSRAITIHQKGKKTTGGLKKSDLVVSKSSGEIVSKAKMKQGKESTWAIDTRFCRNELGLTGMVLFNVGKDGKALYKCVQERKENRSTY